MTALAELTPQESLAAYRRIVLSAVGAAMEAAAGEQRELEAKGQGLVKKVAGLDRAARELEKDLGRKVSAEELSAYLEMPLDEIRDILRMAGDQLGLEQDE
jgi:RNA polymerase primary sigma factor